MTHLRDLNRANSYERGVEDERKRCSDICREIEEREDSLRKAMTDHNSPAFWASVTAADTAAEICAAILEGDE